MAPEERTVPRKAAPAGDTSRGNRKGDPAEESIERLVHELRVHQFELKVQNEELRRAQEELSASRDRYLALFEFAPVGYFTLDRNGSILEANLTAARLLGVDRSTLPGGRFSQFVSPADRNRFLLFYGQLGKPGGQGTFVPLVLTRQELADLVGTTIETAIRVMSRWHKDEVLLTERDGFRVVDRAALESLAE